MWLVANLLDSSALGKENALTELLLNDISEMSKDVYNTVKYHFLVVTLTLLFSRASFPASYC